MAIVKPRDAASVVVLRAGDGGETCVLMGRRHRKAAFAPDVFVFPGGRADAGDAALEPARPLPPQEAARLQAAGAAGPLAARRLASAAIRETMEETGYALGATTEAGGVLRPDHAALHFAARAITPRESPIRFHARFFMADGSGLAGPPRGSGELDDLAWYPLSAAQKLPVFDVTEFILGAIDDLGRRPERVPLFAYRHGRPAIRWVTVA